MSNGNRSWSPESTRTRPERRGNWVFELIPVAVAGVVGAILVNEVVGVIEVSFVGSGLLGVLALAVIVGALNKMASILNANVSTQEKIERQPDDNRDRLNVL